MSWRQLRSFNVFITDCWLIYLLAIMPQLSNFNATFLYGSIFSYMMSCVILFNRSCVFIIWGIFTVVLDIICHISGICTFEGVDICYWYAPKSNRQLYWQRAAGSTPSAKTGPMSDHTYGTPYGECFLSVSYRKSRKHFDTFP